MSAIDQVIGLPELLEQILLHLSMRELLLVQAVDTRFRSTIQHTASLRRKLWLDPRSTRATGVRFMANPLIMAPRAIYLGPGEQLTLYIRAKLLKVQNNGNRVARYPEGSWQHMFVLQPPNEARVWFHNTGDHILPDGFLGNASIPAGFRMGDLVGNTTLPGLELTGPVLHRLHSD